MTIASNLYASKVYSEHPIALWPLDDDVSFISLISENNRKFSTWTTSSTNGNFVGIDNPILPAEASPFDDQTYTSFSLNSIVSAQPIQTVTAKSQNIFNFDNLDKDLATFSINMYLYQNSVDVKSYQIGYEYTDPLSGTVQVLETIAAPTTKQWINFNIMYSIPSEAEGMVKLVIKINLKAIDGGAATTNFIVNGLSVGQWSEVTSSKSKGVYQKTLPTSTTISTTQYGVPADQYGILSDNGYYIVDKKQTTGEIKLLAKNEGIPMAFGSDNVTKLYPPYISGTPSFIFPAKGFLHKTGKNKNYSIEFWLKIYANTQKELRIFGPMNSDYGLYIKEGFLTLLIGNNIQSYNINEWYRPMLIHLVIKNKKFFVFINGEQVIEMEYDNSIIMPNEAYDESWLGFYSYEEIETFEIDCLSIMSYAIPLEMAKRRFVWGQGVDSEDFINNAFLGKTTSIGFSTAEYSANKIYPDVENWNAGYFNNLSATSSKISVPNYSLPEINIGSHSLQEWYDANNQVNTLEYPEISATVVSVSSNTPSLGYAKYTTFSAHNFDVGDSVTISGASVDGYNVVAMIEQIPSATTFVVKNTETQSTTFTSGLASRKHPKFITFRPNIISSPTRWSTSGITWNEQCYLHFPTINIINNQLSAIYGIFEVESSINVSRPLISFVNDMTSQSFDISIINNIISYSFNGQQLYTETLSNIDSHFVVGMHIPTISKTFGYDISTFFASPEIIKMYVGGNGQTTFEGKIYRVGFSDQINYNEISNYFNVGSSNAGIIKIDSSELMHSHFASYTLHPLYRYNRFFLDISISAQWEEYFPLSYFAKYITDRDGNQYYDVDYLQINMGYQSTIERLAQILQNPGWTYQQLFNLYNSPVQKSYEILDNDVITNYQNYNDMKNNVFVDYEINTDKSSVQSYLTFQLLAEGANEPLSSFLYQKGVNDSLVIDARKEATSSEPYKAYYTKFKFVDNTIIYPPKNINFESVAAVIHLDIKQEGIISNPLSISSMEIASNALNENSFNAIGTKHGNPIYPYVKSGIYFGSKETNPVNIYKRNTPYLYLTKNSGIRILTPSDGTKEYGLFLPVNKEKMLNYEIGGLQLWLKYDLAEFETVSSALFEIKYSGGTIEFVVDGDPSLKRGIIYARNKFTKAIYSDIVFYQNGKVVSNPMIMKNEWNSIGIIFSTPLSFNNYNGSINLFAGASFDNISYYLSQGLEQTQNVVARVWRQVLEKTEETDYDWIYWYLSQIESMPSDAELLFGIGIPSNSLGDNGDYYVDSSNYSILGTYTLYGPKSGGTWTEMAGVNPVTPGKWKNVYAVGESKYFEIGIDEVYNALIGVNRTVVDDNFGISVINSDFSLYTDVVFGTAITKKPV